MKKWPHNSYKKCDISGEGQEYFTVSMASDLIRGVNFGKRDLIRGETTVHYCI
jgi:hypothetical protein